MNWKIVSLIAAWYALCAAAYHFAFYIAIKEIVAWAAFFGPFAIYALWLARGMTRCEDGQTRKIAPQRPLRREASSDAPTYPKLADRA